MYVDAEDAAVFHSGLYPKRHPEQHPELPAWGDGRFEWEGADQQRQRALQRRISSTPMAETPRTAPSAFPNPATPVAQNDPLRDGFFEFDGYLSMEAHPQVKNQPYIAQWNNAPAKGWWASDANGSYGPTHRVEHAGRAS